MTLFTTLIGPSAHWPPPGPVTAIWLTSAPCTYWSNVRLTFCGPAATDEPFAGSEEISTLCASAGVAVPSTATTVNASATSAFRI